MNLEFTFTFKGNESFKNKIDERFANDKDLTMQLIGAFGHLIMLAFHLKKEDEVSLVRFLAGAPHDEKKPEENKKVEN